MGGGFYGFNIFWFYTGAASSIFQTPLVEVEQKMHEPPLRKMPNEQTCKSREIAECRKIKNQGNSKIKKSVKFAKPHK